MATLNTLQENDIRDKRVVIRFDGDVPVDATGAIADDYRLNDAMPTIKYLLDCGCSVVLVGHRGRPGGEVDPALSNQVLVPWFQSQLGLPVQLIAQPDPKLITGKVALLENVRFWPGEEENDAGFAQVLARLGDVYVNDAFATMHRDHASITGITRLLPHMAGLHATEEIRVLYGLRQTADTPYLIILGGAKATDKIPVIFSLLDKIDRLILGGIPAITFMAAMNQTIGKHEVSADEVKMARALIGELNSRGITYYLPEDAMLDNQQMTSSNLIPPDRLMMDIGPKSIAKISQMVDNSSTVFWNGAVGKYEMPEFSAGTYGVAKEMALSPAETRVVSGGDTTGAIHRLNLGDKFSFISSGGGATLELLAGKELPGIKVLVKS